MGVKVYSDISVLDAARERISQTFDEVERVFLAFSGGKDSSALYFSAGDGAVV